MMKPSPHLHARQGRTRNSRSVPGPRRPGAQERRPPRGEPGEQSLHGLWSPRAPGHACGPR
jgi:hypothetical protein